MGDWGKPEEFHYQDYSIISGDKEAPGFASVHLKSVGKFTKVIQFKFY